MWITGSSVLSRRRDLLWLGIGMALGLLWSSTGRAAVPSTSARSKKAVAVDSTSDRVEAALYAQGRFLFERNCMVCHGRWGDGKGELAAGMKPKPRNFASGVFKFRSTPSGYLPTDDDLGRTIRQGISLSSMPAFASLRDGEVDALIAYVKSFSRQWNRPSRKAPPVPLPDPPEWFSRETEWLAHAAAGRVLYDRNCAACHGTDGAGNGPAATTLEDAWGDPCPPIDLRLPYVRGGSTVRDLFRSLSTGIDGTPMPSFGESATEAERWNLVAFLDQLRKAHIHQAPPSPPPLNHRISDFQPKTP